MLSQIIINGRDMDLSEYPEVNDRLVNLSPLELQDIKTIVSNINYDILYQGNVTHGIYHSEKVFIYTYLLAQLENIKEPYSSILFDAAIYHDIGRTSDIEDSIHGYASANRIKCMLMDKEIKLSVDYTKNRKYLLLLMALMDAHSREEYINVINEKESLNADLRAFYNIAYMNDMLDDDDLNSEAREVLDIFCKLSKILKDADALDRKRFGDISIASLNEEYLRLDSSKKLVNFADQINKLYFELMKLDYEEIDESNIPAKSCIHSIGFDFFKINSVLEHGILSADGMKQRKLNIPRNFTGGNFDRWISVVDLDLIKENLSAKKEFIDKGISFTCNDVKLHEPMDHNERLKAFETGRPWNKSGHIDERYALLRIPPEKIVSISVPVSYAEKSLLELNYLYNSLDIEMIKNRINYYSRQTNTSPDDVLMKEVNVFVNIYEIELKKYLALTADERKFYDLPAVLNPILNNISSVIGKMVGRFYAKNISIGNKDKITVMDAVLYELSLNTKYSIDTIVTSDDKIVITLNRDKHIINLSKEKIIK